MAFYGIYNFLIRIPIEIFSTVLDVSLKSDLTYQNGIYGILVALVIIDQIKITNIILS